MQNTAHTQNYAAICLVPSLLLLRISCNVGDVARIIRIHVVGVNEGQRDHSLSWLRYT